MADMMRLTLGNLSAQLRTYLEAVRMPKLGIGCAVIRGGHHGQPGPVSVIDRRLMTRPP